MYKWKALVDLLGTPTDEQAVPRQFWGRLHWENMDFGNRVSSIPNFLFF